ncbi:unnamed protein product [Moneuplotes crassus]|uniref:EF-hand domain-containing protein n=1 Tax=Euplotes crassus TaxID=5936 RepID=A0AAD1XUT3_EUPCR|nr:unnamed protein product [Moneuplotes crassus]
MESQIKEVSFATFKSKYFNKLNKPQCFPPCIGEICGGWTQETFKQVIVKLTKNGKAPIQLWLSSPDEIEPISKKIYVRQQVFDIFDNIGCGRIDTMDLISVLQLASNSKVELTVLNFMKIFGFVQKIFTKDEFHFYLDSLFSGIMASGILNGDRNPHPDFRGARVLSEDIESLVLDIFEGEEILERDLFSKRFLEHSELGPMFIYFQGCYTACSKYLKQKAMELIHLNTAIRIWVYEWVKAAVVQSEGEA